VTETTDEFRDLPVLSSSLLLDLPDLPVDSPLRTLSGRRHRTAVSQLATRPSLLRSSHVARER
jgi:hypothetical protein